MYSENYRMVDLDSEQSQANDLGAQNRGEIYLDIVKFGGITLVSKNYGEIDLDSENYGAVGLDA